MDFLNFIAELLASDAFKGFMLVVAAGIAIGSIHTARAVARKKQSADLLFASRTDTKFSDGTALIRSLSSATDRNIATLAFSSKPEDAEDKESIRYVLNHLECIAVGIRHGIYDEGMLKAAWHGQIIDTYDAAQPLLTKLRSKHPTMLQEFCALANRWKNKPLRTIK